MKDVPSYQPRKNGEVAPGDPARNTLRLTIVFSPADQSVTLDYDPTQIKTFELILGIIEMGKNDAALKRTIAIQNNMAAMAMQAQQEAAVRSRLHLGK